jgi:Tol biopolymer transport system component
VLARSNVWSYICFQSARTAGLTGGLEAQAADARGTTLNLRHKLLATGLTHPARNAGRCVALLLLAISQLVTADDRISYSSFRPASWNIYLLRAGKAPRQLTEGPTLNYDAVFSPDGRFVVFTSERNGTPQLFVLDVERGGTPRLLVRSDGFEDQAAISPDGHTLVFVSDREGNADLYSIPFDPTHTVDISLARRLTSHPAADLRPAFSPDGRTIVFTSTRDSVDRGHPVFTFAIQSFGSLYALDLESGRATRLTDAEGWDGTAAFSVDGKLIYFYSERLAPHYPRLFVMNSDGSAQRPAGPDHRAIKPAPWSDGRVVYESWTEGESGGPGNWELRVFDSHDGSDVPLSSGNIVCHDPAVSVRGHSILCHGVARDTASGAGAADDFPGPLLAPGYPRQARLHDRSVSVYPFRNAFSAPLNPQADEVAYLSSPFTVSVMSLQTGSIRSLVSFDPKNLTADRRRITDVTWSPEGRQIALSIKKFRDSSKPGEIWIVNSDGTGLTSLTGDRAAAAGMPSFGANGKKISFTARVGKTTKLMLMNSDGSGLQQLTHNDDRENFAALSPSGTSMVYGSDHDGIADPPSGERRFSLYLASVTPAGDLVDVRRLTKTSAQVGHPRFSPDGLWIVYTSGEGGLNDEAPINTSLMFSPQSDGEIWAYRLADGLRVRLTHDKWEDGEPFWAPPVSATSP